MQTLKSSKWLLKLLNIIVCFLIYNGDTENTEIFLHGFVIVKNINSVFSVSLVVFYFLVLHAHVIS